MKTRTLVAIVALAGMLAFAAAPATAGIIMDIGFDVLDGSYGLVNAGEYNVDDNSLTEGGVTRLFPTGGTADFDAGYAGGTPDFTLWMTISNITATTADGVGSFTVTDDDGDTITGDFSGSWEKIGGFSFFGGTVSNVFLFDNGAADGTFDGPSGGSFDLDFSPQVEPFTGAIVNLSSAGGWFTSSSFSGSVDDVTIQVIPAPGAALLAVMGMGMIGRIRRRNA